MSLSVPLRKKKAAAVPSVSSTVLIDLLPGELVPDLLPSPTLALHWWTWYPVTPSLLLPLQGKSLWLRLPRFNSCSFSARDLVALVTLSRELCSAPTDESVLFQMEDWLELYVRQ